MSKFQRNDKNAGGGQPSDGDRSGEPAPQSNIVPFRPKRPETPARDDPPTPPSAA